MLSIPNDAFVHKNDELLIFDLLDKRSKLCIFIPQEICKLISKLGCTEYVSKETFANSISSEEIITCLSDLKLFDNDSKIIKIIANMAEFCRHDYGFMARANIYIRASINSALYLFSDRFYIEGLSSIVIFRKIFPLGVSTGCISTISLDYHEAYQAIVFIQNEFNDTLSLIYESNNDLDVDYKITTELKFDNTKPALNRYHIVIKYSISHDF